MELTPDMKTMEEKIKKILKTFHMITSATGGAPEYRIQSAEETLQVSYPADYRRFLELYGSIGFGAFEVYGILQQNPEAVPNGLWATMQLRARNNLPDQYIVIGADGFGGYLCLDTDQLTAEGNAAVIIVDLYASADEDIVVEKLADTFWEYLFEQMKTEVTYYLYEQKKRTQE